SLIVTRCFYDNRKRSFVEFPRQILLYFSNFAKDSLAMGTAPIDMRASRTFRKRLVRGVDERRYALAYDFAVDFDQRRVAARAPREGILEDVEWMARENFAKLLTEVVRMQKENIRRGFQALVAGQHDAAVGTSNLEHRGAVDPLVEGRVGAQHPQPSRETGEHPISSEF